MAEGKVTKLRNGIKVCCDKCKKGNFVPYNSTKEKAFTFVCSNPECDNFIRVEPQINID